MSHWQRLPNYSFNTQFANIENPERIIYPDLRDGSTLVLGSDYSGEHAVPEFRVLSFLLTTYKSIAAWDPLRMSVRKTHLADGRRMSFKALSDAMRVNAMPSFLRAASQLNGILVCVAVEKGYALPQDNLPPLEHDWMRDPLRKLLEISFFGGILISGLRGNGQNVHWITDDDAIVSTTKAQHDAAHVMGGLLHKHPDEQLTLTLGIASKFDDERRAEDLVAIPDLAAGAFSETLTTIGKSNLPTPSSGPSDPQVFTQIKSILINAWGGETDKPLKHMNVIIRIADNGQTLVSFCGSPSPRVLRSGELTDRAPILNSKWRKALEADMKNRGIDPPAAP